MHDERNEAAWESLFAARERGERAGIHWYLTDAPPIAREASGPTTPAGLLAGLSAAYEQSLARACLAFSDIGVSEHFVERVPSNRFREGWADRAIAHLAGCDFVLLTPDSGITFGTPGTEHAAIREVAKFAEQIGTVALLQHLNRQAVDQLSAAIEAELHAALPKKQVNFGPVRHQAFVVLVADC